MDMIIIVIINLKGFIVLGVSEKGRPAGRSGRPAGHARR